MASYTPGRGYSGGGQQGRDITLGDIISQSKSGYRTQSLWRGRSNFLQTSGDEDRSIMPNTTVPRGTGRGGPAAQGAWRLGKDFAKMKLGVPDITLGGWGSGGYKVRDVIQAVKERNAGTNFQFNQPTGPVQGPLKPPPGFGPPSGPAAGPGPGPGPLPNPTGLPKPTAVPPTPVMVGNMVRNPTPNLNLNNPVVLGGVNAAVKAGQAVTGVLGGSGVVSQAARAGVTAATGGVVRPSVVKAAAQAGGRGINAAAGRVVKNIPPPPL